MSATSHAKRLIFSPRTWDLREFERLAAGAKAAGFTHIVVSELADRTIFQPEDQDSPWTAWAALLPSLFKHVTPPGLEKAYPAEWVARQMAFLKAKHDIVAKLGMKAAYMGQEPHMLSEAVYREHPQWRGSRVDNSLRATGMYFSPNTDHPEVRAAYRAGVCALLKQCPAIDIFFFGTNDSGGFYPWDKRLFQGPNGPTGYERRDMGKRVVDFLSELRAGAQDAGGQADVYTNIHGWFTDDETHLVMRSLKPGIGCANGVAWGEYTAECSMLGAGNWGGTTWHPGMIFDHMPTPHAVIAGATAVQTHPCRQFCSGGAGTHFFDAFKLAMSLPPATSTRLRVANLTRLAAELYDPEIADDVVDAWNTLERAALMADMSGAGTLGGPVMLRWLTRPFVSHQELLRDDEKSYWEPYIYQSRASHADKYLDYLNVVGYQIVSTWGEASKICCAIDSVEGTLAAAAGQLEAAARKTRKRDAADKLINDAFQVRAERCVYLTVRHYLQLGTLIYVRDGQNAIAPKTTAVSPEPTPMPKGDLGDQGLWYLHRAMRWELDNTYDLIDLMKRSPQPLFYTAPVPSFTGPLQLESNLLENLERKADITLRHWRNAEIGWYRATYGG